MQSSKQSVNQSIKNIKVKAKVKESMYCFVFLFLVFSP